MNSLAETLSDFSSDPLSLSLALGALALLLLCAALLIVLVRRTARGRREPGWARELRTLMESAANNQSALMGQLRGELADGARGAREELASNLALVQQALLSQGSSAMRGQSEKLDSFAQQLAQLRAQMSETLVSQLQSLSQFNGAHLDQMRSTLEAQLAQLHSSNSAKLEEMRQTVDEKLQATLQERLGQSFKLVAERLEQVYLGLGQMQTLAQGVGDLKHLLTNVKTRGIFGEMQLAGLLEEVFTPSQYAAQVATRNGSLERVDFAIRMPGKSAEGSEPLWLPIDAKFPSEDYERLVQAQHRADAGAAQAAAQALEARIRQQAKSIGEKYIEPPYTTDFAILFLPSEGLYAEVLRRPGLIEDLQRQYHITVAGPTTLLALLNALQMGFRTLALQERSSQVWLVLAGVKSEFAKFADTLDKVKRQTQTMLNTLDETGRRTRALSRKLSVVQDEPQLAGEAPLTLERQSNANGMLEEILPGDEPATTAGFGRRNMRQEPQQITQQITQQDGRQEGRQEGREEGRHATDRTTDQGFKAPSPQEDS